MWHFTWTQVLPYQRQPGIVPKIELTPSAAFEGILQAGCGGVVWGITLSIAVAFAWIVFMRGSPAKTFKRRMATVFACIIGGLAGGVLLDLSILPVTGPVAMRRRLDHGHRSPPMTDSLAIIKAEVHA